MKLSNEKGFTLIELLVVVAIIGILAAIAIPQFAIYRQRGFDSTAQSDLANGRLAEEAYFAQWETYVVASCANATCTGSPLPPGLTGSNNVTMAFALSGTDAFTGTSQHAKGPTAYGYDSATGLMTHNP